MIGIVNDKIDIFDNQFFKIEAYRLNPHKNLNETIDLRLCEKEDLLRMMSPLVASYYPNSVCFKNRKGLNVTDNWFVSDYSMIFLSIEECSKTTKNGGKCANPK